MAFILIVAGSQGFDDYNLLSSKLDILLKNRTEIIIRQGECPNSPDTLAKRYAEERGYFLQSFAADWNRGRGAGWARNWEMAKGNGLYPGRADGLAAFTAGTRGTANMIEIAEKCGIPVRIVSVVVDPAKLPKRNRKGIAFHDTLHSPVNDSTKLCPPKNVRTNSGTGVIISPETPIATATLQQPYNPLDTAIPAGKPRPRKPSPIIVAGEELIPDTKPKKRPPAKSGQTVYKYDYKQIYLDAHMGWFAKEYPSAYRNGHYDKPKKVPAVDTANGLASYILNHLSWTGNYGIRINVMGRQVGGFTKTRSGATFDDRKFITSSTKKGSADLDILVRGVNAKIEIKIGGDTQSADQIKQETRIKKAGGQYELWKSVDHYLDFYFRIMAQQNLFGE